MGRAAEAPEWIEDAFMKVYMRGYRYKQNLEKISMLITISHQPGLTVHHYSSNTDFFQSLLASSALTCEGTTSVLLGARETEYIGGAASNVYLTARGWYLGKRCTV